MSTKHKRRIKYMAFTLAPALLIGLVALVTTMSVGSSPVTLADAAETAPCNACHNNTTLIEGKETQWAESGHGTGTAYLRGTSKSCAGCHSGGGFSAMVASGLQPNSSAMVGDPDPTRQDCRTCHQTHTTYTGVDWALETTADVSLYAIAGTTFSGGKGNLCASCHQPRTNAPSVAAGGTVTGISTHWGPHHGPQSSMMLGTGGAGAAKVGTPASHYSITDTCVACHMGSGKNHMNAPNVATCKGCHTTATNLDVNGAQTAVQAKLDTLKPLLVNAGVLACEIDEEGVESCHAAVTSAPDTTAYALWNYILIANEDGSKGAHNPAYTNALLDDAIASMTP